MKSHKLESYITSNNPLCFDKTSACIRFVDFWQDVKSETQQIVKQPSECFALWSDDSYDFLVLFFAVVLSKKTLILPASRLFEVANNNYKVEFIERGILDRRVSEKTDDIDICFDESIYENSKIIFFTSGSTGKPKKIQRNLAQLLLEVDHLKKTFNFSEELVALATVSHQHIYGLLFKLLLPLSYGHSFYRGIVLYPEHLTHLQEHFTNNYVVSSPALLKRWEEESSFGHSAYVFSSGGSLPEYISSSLGINIIEILGSSETGGIAYKINTNEWTVFENVSIQLADNHLLEVRTPYGFTHEWIQTGDCISDVYTHDGRTYFKLLGRMDRIIKLEERRISLDYIESIIKTSKYIKDCHVLLTMPKEGRQVLSCVTVLSDEYNDILKSNKKNDVIGLIKENLRNVLDTMMLPKRWRFVSKIPINSQSKIDKSEVKAVFYEMKYPLVLSQKVDNSFSCLELEFLPELYCFKGHFPDIPIYPGFGQIAFVQYFAKNIWHHLGYCVGFQQLKFQELIKPYEILQLSLEINENKVNFKLKKHEKIVSSGRLLFTDIRDEHEE